MDPQQHFFLDGLNFGFGWTGFQGTFHMLTTNIHIIRIIFAGIHVTITTKRENRINTGILNLKNMTHQMAFRLIIDALASDDTILSVIDTKFRLSTSRSRTCTLNNCDSPSECNWMAFIFGFGFGFTSTLDSGHFWFLQAVARMPL